MILHVHVVAGKCLKEMDRDGTSDTYTCVQVGTLAKDKTEKEKKFQTKVAKKNLNPAYEWDEVFRVALSLQERQGELLLERMIWLGISTCLSTQSPWRCSKS